MQVISVAFTGLITIITSSKIYFLIQLLMLYKKSSIWHESHVIANNRGYCVISTNHIQCDNVGFAKKSFSKTRSTEKKKKTQYAIFL